jgi:putative ABC transport system substrate-binding protein
MCQAASIKGSNNSRPRPSFLWNPDNDSNLAFLEELIIAVPALGLQLISVPMRTSEALEPAFAAMMRRKPNAFDLLIQRHIGEIIGFMEKHRLPAMYQTKENVKLGGLMSYGTSLSDLFRRRLNCSCTRSRSHPT